MLATGNVTIASGATVDISGAPPNGLVPGSGGPGGFDGGSGGVSCAGAGLGPGGGGAGCGGNTSNGGAGGSFKTAGAPSCGTTGLTYGNDSLVPLVGGSGGGGSNGGGSFGLAGAGGGGAILIATSGTFNLSGGILATGGTGSGAGSGAGGGIRLVATASTGTGNVSVIGGGLTAFNCGNGNDGGAGRVRLEFCQNNFLGSFPLGTSIATSASPIFLANLPTLAISAIEGATLPSNPAGSFNLPPDLTFGAGTSSVTVNLAAKNVPLGTTVTVKVTPQAGLPTSVTSTALSGTLANSTASAEVTLATGKSLITAEATITINQGGGAGLQLGRIDGEQIEKVRIAATYGGASSLTYITASGKEFRADAATPG
jgi:hypothetical protein